MNRLALFFGLVLILLSFIAGALVASRSALEDTPIVLARATAEAARGQQEIARADAERAKAAAEWAHTSEEQTRAAALAGAQAQITTGLQALAVGLPAILVVVAAGLATAAMRWSWRRAAVGVFFPKAGVSPVLLVEHGGQLVLSDAGRSLGGVLVVGADGKTKQPLAAAPEVQAQLSAQALAANVIAAAAGDRAKTEAAGAVGEALQSALASLPALAPSGKGAPQVVFSQPKDDGGTMRVVKRTTPATINAPKDKPGVVKRGHLADFLKAGAVRGFGRREFADFTFSDGTRCSQTLWGELRQAAKDAGVLHEAGGRWALAGSLPEALERLGLSEFLEQGPEAG
jgi:hypothetical protein